MRKFSALLLMAVLALLTAPAHAQGNTPLLVTYRGDLWSWENGKLKNLTTWGFNNAPDLSPDGKTAAYASVASVAVNAIKASGGGGAGALPTNIWLLTLATNDGVRIADQPAGASIFSSSVKDNYILRSDPSWSPDGSALAWTELAVKGTGTEKTYSLKLYTVATKTLREIATFESQNYEGYVPVPVRWGTAGIAVMKRFVHLPQAAGGSVLVYSPEGKLLSSSPEINNLREIDWISNGATAEVIGVVSTEKGPALSLIDPQTGAVSDLPGTPELYSPSAPEGLTLSPKTPGDYNTWTIAQKSAVVKTFSLSGPDFRLRNALAIAPDGAQVAYVTKQGVTVDGTDDPVSVLSSNERISIVWGQVQWRIRPSAG